MEWAYVIGSWQYTFERKNVELLAGEFASMIKMLIRAAKDFDDVPTSFWPTVIWLNNCHKGFCGLTPAAGNSLSLSFSHSLPGVHSPGYLKERAHQHTPAWWRPQAEG